MRPCQDIQGSGVISSSFGQFTTRDRGTIGNFVWGHYDDLEGDIAWHAARNPAFPTTCWPGLMPNQPATAILLVHLVGFQRSMARLLATALWLPFQWNSPLPSDISFRSLGQPACSFEHLGFTL